MASNHDAYALSLADNLGTSLGKNCAATTSATTTSENASLLGTKSAVNDLNAATISTQSTPTQEEVPNLDQKLNH